MVIHSNSINDSDVRYIPNPPTSTRSERPCTLSRVQSNISAAARRRARQIRNNRRNFIPTASTLLREVATNQVDMHAEQVAIRAESQAFENSMNAASLSFELRLQDLERNLGRVTHNVFLMLRRLNEWKNEVNRNVCSDEILDLRAATVDIVRNAAYLGNDGNDSEDDLNV